MKIWVDDIRTPPDGYVWKKSVNDVINLIKYCENIIINEYPFTFTSSLIIESYAIELIDIDHDAGDYASDGGDYIRLLDWLEETGRNYPIRIHSMNPVGVANMRTVIQRNNWVEVQ